MPLLRLLAEGEPVAVAELASSSSLSEDAVRQGLAAVPDTEYADEGRIMGLALTMRPTPHRFTVAGGTALHLVRPGYPLLPGTDRISTPTPTNAYATRWLAATGPVLLASRSDPLRFCQQTACSPNHGSGSMAVVPFCKTSKCKCAPNDLPVLPVRPMYSPTLTVSPTCT